MLKNIKSKLKNLVGVLFVFGGFILAIGCASPEKENIQILIQGISGIFMIWLGYKISKEPVKPIEIIGMAEIHQDSDEAKELSEAIHNFRRAKHFETGQTIPVVIYMKRSFVHKIRYRSQNVFHPEKETFEGWPVKILPEEHDVDFKIFKARV